jgi:phosphatidylinositol glycan class P protein
MQKTVPNQHNPSPTPERAVYGFILYILATAGFVLYLVWLFVPENILHSIGIGEFLPQKYWAVALPIYFSVAFFLFVFIVYPSLGLLVTPTIKDVRNITDEFAIYNAEKVQDKEKIPRVYDLHPCDLIRKND